MSRFGPDPRAFFDAVYDGTAPWEVGGAQPALASVLEEYPPADPILDVGCGSGDLALALAMGGRRVVGIDFAEGAIEQARRKRASLPPEVAARVDFQVADARFPSRLRQQFGSVVDSGFFHLFEAEDGDRFVDELARTLGPGGRYYLLAFAVTFPVANVPRAVTVEEVHARFTESRGWRILVCRSAELLSRVARVPATCACIEKL